jgi:hypothetical protein
MNQQPVTYFTSGGNCPSCGAPFEGKFCYKCGEKRVDLKDYSFKKYFEQTLDVFTHFDGKFFRSIKYLLFYPGKLTEEYLGGMRIKLMKPFQLYIIINLVFFFFLRDFDIFYQNFHYTKTRTDYFSAKAIDMAKQKAAKKHISYEQLIQQFNEKAPDYGKAFLLLFIPVLGLISYLLFFYRISQFVPHLIYATHIFTAVLCISGFYTELIVKPMLHYYDGFFFAHRENIWMVMAVVIFVYLCFAKRRVFKEHWLIIIPKAFAFFIAYGWISNKYKVLINFVTLYFI